MQHPGCQRSAPPEAIVLVLALSGFVVSCGLFAYGSLAGLLDYNVIGYAVVAAPFAFLFAAAATALSWRDNRTVRRRDFGRPHGVPGTFRE
jgi:hypothetical protein